ncbi:MAG: NAD(P)/FAD-dependent oxidoreductase [Chloroflexia bacterium]|nr:NAD(P)/FAD-dependent oxidoreductase [Chloroflexia bacterium]
MTSAPDAIVIGSGPNGLAAAIRLAQAGRAVAVYEAASVPGGGARSAELTLPGFIHDPFAAVFPTAVASPFFGRLGLERLGMEWIAPPALLAHPLDDGSAVMLYRSVERTAAGLGSDGDSYRGAIAPFVANAPLLIQDLLAPPGAQRHLQTFAKFGPHAIRSATGFASSHFHADEASALLAGNAAHSFLPLEAPLTAGFGLFLMILGHAMGWPIPKGGASAVSAALVETLLSLGVELHLNHRVRSLAELPAADAVFFDTDPRQMAAIAGSRLPPHFRARLLRHRYGPGAFKIDYALDGPVPSSAAACLYAGTVHIGGSLEEIARSESEMTRGKHPERPFIIVSQPSLFDATRAPHGRQTLWAYCHVPAGSTVDMTERIERQIERFAPGFRDRILARHVMSPRDLETANANLVGGAINGGFQDFRTYLRWALSRPSPYATPNPALFRCSAATPPGGGVHGMAGFHAAEYTLREGRFGSHGKRGMPPSV